MFHENWSWWSAGREPVRVLGSAELWGHAVVDIVSPATGRLLRLEASQVATLSQRVWTSDELQWRAAALRCLWLALEGEPLAARLDGVTLLPHQLATVVRALAMNQVRLGICDEVGLGKTITAGAIATELRSRRRIKRILVVAPKGVQLQWVAEMHDRFAEDYVRVGPEGIPVDGAPNVWSAFDRVVTSIDAVKPLRVRAGWTPQQIDAYNRNRFLGLTEARWDLVIIDEAHHVAGSDESVARHRLARELAAKCPHVLLLSATPHSGKSESFRRFLGLIDAGFFAGRLVDRDSVAAVIARTEKRSAIDAAGNPLFQPRTTTLETVSWVGHERHQRLYDEVTDYVRDGYLRARSTGRTATGFLMLLLQRQVASSTPAILSALERRFRALAEAGRLHLGRELDIDDWLERSGEEQESALELDGLPVIEDEATRLASLLELARDCHASGPDPKTLFFLQLLRRLRRDEGDPRAKVLVFTEFRATQQMLLEVLDGQGIPAVFVNGDMGLQERAIAQQKFRDEVEVLVSTDAGGEGVNLQFAHLVVNWDLPWAPTRLEQRIGRVDRIGQTRAVRAINMILADSVDLRVLEVLEAKLDIIEDELGAGKRGDILDSADRRVGDLYAGIIVNPATAAEVGAEFEQRVRADLSAEMAGWELLKATTAVHAVTHESELPNALAAAGTALARITGAPARDAVEALDYLPVMAPGEPVPVVRGGVDGWLSLWLVRGSDGGGQSGAYAIFQTGTGRLDPHHAERVWRLLCDTPNLVGVVELEAEEWNELGSQGIDFGFATVQKVTNGEDPAPRIDLGLLVRIVE